MKKSKNNDLFFIGIIFVVLAFFTYKSISLGFIQEDWLLIKNYTIDELLTVFHSSWSPIYRQEYFRPLTILSYAIDYKIFGLNFMAHHFVHLSYYFIMLLLLYFSIKKFSSSSNVAFFSTIFFLINPISAYHAKILTQRTDVLGLLFTILSFYIFLFYKDNKSMIYLTISIIVYLFAILSKETYLIYIGLIFFIALNKKNDEKKRYVIYFIYITTISFVYLIYWKLLNLPTNPSPNLSSYVHALLNVYYSNEATIKTDQIAIQFIILIAITFILLKSKYKYFTSKIMVIIFILSIIFSLSDRIRLLTIPGIIFSYYIAVNLYLLLKNVRKKSFYNCSMLLSILFLFLSYSFIGIIYKKELGINSSYFKYANLVFFQDRDIIPKENVIKYDALINQWNLNQYEQKEYIKSWLNKDEKKSISNKYIKYISLFMFTLIFLKYVKKYFYLMKYFLRHMLKIMKE